MKRQFRICVLLVKPIQMNVAAQFAFLVLVYDAMGLSFNGLQSNGGSFIYAIVLFVLALIAALPVTIGLIDFSISQRPKWRRFKHGLIMLF